MAMSGRLKLVREIAEGYRVSVMGPGATRLPLMRRRHCSLWKAIGSGFVLSPAEAEAVGVSATMQRVIAGAYDPATIEEIDQSMLVRVQYAAITAMKNDMRSAMNATTAIMVA